MGRPFPWPLVEAGKEVDVPALLRRAAAPGNIGIRAIADVMESPVEVHSAIALVPDGHVISRRPGEAEGQDGAVPGVFEQQFGVSSCWSRDALRPRRSLQLGAARMNWDGWIVGAHGQAVVVHGQSRKEEAVPEGAVWQERHKRRGELAHSLRRRNSSENALTARHHEPRHRGRCNGPRAAIDTVQEAAERCALLHHFIPVVIDRPEENDADVEGNAAIACKQRVHQCVLLHLRLKVAPYTR
mmetsp:Transcript_32043/g.70045  ORF Transcript_32043/g.70045 Transcript_32043/m.70045 type:complete len:242 (-) Transcript_32043:595-1320(-)